MKGVRVTSMAELRKNFDFTNAKDYLRQGRLSRWVRELGENDLADELDGLKDGEYSDQTLLDNFIGIFELKGEKARLPEPEAPAQEEETLPAVTAHSQALPAVLVADIEHPEECAYVDSAVCFRDSRTVAADQSVAMYNVEGNSPSALHKYMKNKMALKIIREIVLSNLPEGLHEKYGYRIEITLQSHFVNDLGFNERGLRRLADKLNEKFIGLLMEADGNGLSRRIFGSCAITTVGKLLDSIRVCELISYTDDEAKQLLEDGF